MDESDCHGHPLVLPGALGLPQKAQRSASVPLHPVLFLQTLQVDGWLEPRQSQRSRGTRDGIIGQGRTLEGEVTIMVPIDFGHELGRKLDP
tara:strand:- start:22 stop:294 length:273 start_codon:yes stop_codon:yes gene_type:complete